ncbi:hypothetical protein QNO07_10025 [Streptomyces sp. 549]|uniref:hypothetical protein n=1 Tax=Streptomyces sp. 549 TaxID=3049076 RepID=UPI0024C331E9|nr:hypothetical protein [Streptomyces sp. 549]MDK1473752.1 hypothetical protein [Streptomyces sp. 549]
MSTPVKEHREPPEATSPSEHIPADRLRELFAAPSAAAPALPLGGPALLLAGEDDDGLEPHIWRGID